MRLRATLRLIDMPAELDKSLLDEPGTLLADPRVRVIAVLRSVIDEGIEGMIKVPWVMGREIRGPVAVPRDGILFVRPELQLEDGQVSYELAAEEAATEGNLGRKPLGRRQIRIGLQDVLEEHAKPFGRKQLSVLSFEPAAPDGGSGSLGPATGGYTFGPVMERVIHDPDKGSGDCLIDFDTGKLAGIPDDPGLKERLRNTFRETMDQEIRSSPTGNGMDAIARISHSPLEGGLVGVHLIATLNSWWTARDPALLIEAINEADLAPTKQPKFVKMGTYGDDIANEHAWMFCTDEGLIGLVKVAGFTDDQSGVKILYKLVQPPSIGWDPAPNTLHVPPNVVEEALLPGGRSPDGKHEVRVYGRPDDMPWHYVLRIHSADNKDQPIAVLNETGGYLRYRAAKEQCTALWDPSGKFVVVSDRGTKRTREIYLLHVSGNRAERLSLPDYVLNAFGRVDATEGNRLITSTPERWDDDDLHVKLRFDTTQGQYACDVVLHVSHTEHSVPRVSLASCSEPVKDTDGN